MDREDFVTRLNMLQLYRWGLSDPLMRSLPFRKLGGPEIWVKRDDLTGWECGNRSGN
jgi:1-aminocyclopropane-1-carboxylate deaminase/D-cysteine desulfhydrase-like pyridoxal-dependent ACC family enzyme